MSCPPHFTGTNCDLPICENHGHLDYGNKICICRNYFAPPFCQGCLPDYWGTDCDLRNIEPTEVNDLMHTTLGDSIVIIIIVIHFICACLLAYWLLKDCSIPKQEYSIDPPTYEEAINGSDGLITERELLRRARQQCFFGFFLLLFISLSAVMCIAFYLSYTDRHAHNKPSFTGSAVIGIKYALFSFTSTFTIGVIILCYVQFLRIMEVTKSIWNTRENTLL